MVEPKLTSVSQSTGAISSRSTTKTDASKDTGGVAFRALLERLERDAHALEEHAKDIGDPKALAGAVDRAEASLQDVLSLGDKLLEAYREACSQSRMKGGK